MCLFFSLVTPAGKGATCSVFNILQLHLQKSVNKHEMICKSFEFYKTAYELLQLRSVICHFLVFKAEKGALCCSFTALFCTAETSCSTSQVLCYSCSMEDFSCPVLRGVIWLTAVDSSRASLAPGLSHYDDALLEHVQSE